MRRKKRGKQEGKTRLMRPIALRGLLDKVKLTMDRGCRSTSSVTDVQNNENTTTIYKNCFFTEPSKLLNTLNQICDPITIQPD